MLLKYSAGNKLKITDVMLVIKQATKVYRKGQEMFTALDNISASFREGEFVVVEGPSGCGKSTLLHTIGGLIRPDSGQVLYRGNNIYDMSPGASNRYRKENVGFVFQQFHLMPYLTVFENISLAGGKSVEKAGTVKSLLEKCAVFPLRNKYPAELSVGEKQRTAFIRAIITNPEILLADEPTGNLDPENSKLLMSMIKEYHSNGGTVILVSHNTGLAKYADRIITLQSGKILNDTASSH